VIEPDVKAFREANKKIFDKCGTIWTRALRETVQNFKA
jgi:hypothetical protein